MTTLSAASVSWLLLLNFGRSIQVEVRVIGGSSLATTMQQPHEARDRVRYSKVNTSADWWSDDRGYLFRCLSHHSN